MTYDLTTLFAGNNIFEIFLALNNLTNQLLSIFILLVLFLISYMNINAVEYSRKFMISSLIISVVGTLFWFAGLISWYYASIAQIILLITIVYEAFS